MQVGIHSDVVCYGSDLAHCETDIYKVCRHKVASMAAVFVRLNHVSELVRGYEDLGNRGRL